MNGAHRLSAFRIIDTHCHLDVSAFDPDREQVLASARRLGVSAIVVPGIHQPSAFHECQFSKAAWDKLDDRTKELMKRAGQTYFFNFWLEVGHKDAPAFQNFKKDSNVEIVDLDANFKAAAKKAAEAVARQAEKEV